MTKKETPEGAKPSPKGKPDSKSVAAGGKSARPHSKAVAADKGEKKTPGKAAPAKKTVKAAAGEKAAPKAAAKKKAPATRAKAAKPETSAASKPRARKPKETATQAPPARRRPTRAARPQPVEVEKKGPAREVKAVSRYLRMAPRKLRLAVDLIRGKQVTEAMNLLRFTPKRAAGVVGKVLKSAVSNAENNHKLDEGDLVVAKAFVDQGPTFPMRFLPRAMGRASAIHIRTSHVTIVVREREEG